LEDWKIKISVLWLFSAVAFLAHQILALLEPGVIAGIMAGEVEGMKIGPELILLFAILFLVPLIMAFLSLTLKDSINRWANIIVGVVFAALFIGVIATVAKLSGEILMTLSTVVALALIVWYAWKSKQKV
jgi:tetrahydromethanopterin S-methyltransferase subunit F